MRGKFLFVYVDTWFDLIKCKFILKSSNLKGVFAYCCMFTKIMYGYNFEASLITLSS